MTPPMTPTPAVSAKEKALAALTSAREQLEGYERDATGESYNDTQINAAIEGLAAALSATEGEAEPVAWRVDIPNFGPALFHDEAEAKAQLAEPGCEQSTIRALVYASPPSAPAGVKVKPLDLSNILKHAFLSGVVAAREIAGHDECDGPALWAKYEPYEPGSYDRIRSSLQPDTQALEDAIALIEKLMASHDYVGTGDSHWAAIERREDEAALSRIRSALQPATASAPAQEGRHD